MPLPTGGLALLSGGGGNDVMRVTSQITLMGFDFAFAPLNDSVVSVCVVDGTLLTSSLRVPTGAEIVACAGGSRPFGFELGDAQCRAQFLQVPAAQAATVSLQSCSFSLSSTVTVLLYVASSAADTVGSIFGQSWPAPTNALRAPPTVVAIR